jgi:hypothetical protein
MDFYNYMCEKDSSENHKINNLKVVIDYASTLGMCVYKMSIKKAKLLPFQIPRLKVYPQTLTKDGLPPGITFLS